MRVDVASHESVVAGRKDNLDQTVVVFSIGTAPYFNRKALATAVVSWRALKFKPSSAVVIHVGGYDDDPRELWQIPEVCAFVRRFCEKTKAHEDPALDPMSRNLLLLCGADPGIEPEVIMISPDESADATMDFFKSRMANHGD